MIVSDATAIITLININEFDLLKLFTKKIILTKIVFDEVTIYEQAKKYLECEKNFIEIVEHDDERLFNEFCLLLDAGEGSSIILAMQKKLPLIIDEKKGRVFAKRMDIKVIGLIGIIKYLYTEEKITFERCNTLLQKLKHSDFRINQKLIDLVLEK